MNNEFFIEKTKYGSRKDLLIHYLMILHKSNQPIKFGDLLMDNIPSGGINEFESVLSELENKKWIIKSISNTENETSYFPYKTVDKRFSISLEGVEYLDSLGLIIDKNKKIKKDNFINNYGNMIIGDNSKKVNQSSEYSPNNKKSKPNTINIIATVIGIILSLIAVIIAWLEYVKN